MATTPTLAEQFDRHQAALDSAYTNMHQQQKQAALQYNRHRITPHTYTIGDFAWLSREGIQWNPESALHNAVKPPFLGPFRVTAVDQQLDNITLELPASMRIHNVFHVSSLTPWRDPCQHFPNRTAQNQPPPEIIDNVEEFEVESILDYKTTHRGRRHFFLIRWKGYGREYDSWEPPANLTHCHNLLRTFLAANPHCPYRLVASGTSARGGVRV